MAQTNVSRALLENIYFSAQIWAEKDQYKYFFMQHIEPDLAELRRAALKNETFIMPGYQIMPFGISRYEYGINVNDNYRIYFARNFGDNYPIYIIVNAQYLHTTSVKEVLNTVKDSIEKIYKHFHKTFKLDTYYVKLSRVDICNHNNFIDINTYITPGNFNDRAVTRIREVFSHTVLNGESDEEIDYYRYGKGNVVVRIYNKTKEVIEQKQKAFFFKLWKDCNLIDENIYNVYEQCYKMHTPKMNYKVCYLAASLLASNAPNHIKELAAEIHKNPKLDNDEKYDQIKALVIKNKVEVPYELTNVEFQLRSEFLKSLNLLNLETGEIIDFTNIEALSENIDQLYQYLTNETFRVVTPRKNSRIKEKRKREVDKLWKLIQTSQVENIDHSSVSNEKRKLYRKYNKTMSELKTLERVRTAAAHLYYITNENVNLNNVDSISISQIVENIKNVNSMNETYFNDMDLLMKQIHRHGEKSKTYIKITNCRKFEIKLRKQRKLIKSLRNRNIKNKKTYFKIFKQFI